MYFDRHYPNCPDGKVMTGWTVETQSGTNIRVKYTCYAATYVYPTAAPTPRPTQPTPIPTAIPTAIPTPLPTVNSTPLPTVNPTFLPTVNPTAAPTNGVHYAKTIAGVFACPMSLNETVLQFQACYQVAPSYAALAKEY